jgi:hypothetical protein
VKHCLLLLFLVLLVFILTWIPLWFVLTLALAVETMLDHTGLCILALVGVVCIVFWLHSGLGWLYRRYLEKL